MNNKTALYIILGIFLVPFIFQFLLGGLVASSILLTINPLAEVLTCNGMQCSSAPETLLSGITITPDNRNMVTDKNQLEIQVVTDFLGINQYYIRMKNDNERYAFRSSYLIRANAERDLKRIKENNNVKIVKRNVIFTQMLCLILYIILLVIGIIINKVRQYDNARQALLDNSNRQR